MACPDARNGNNCLHRLNALIMTQGASSLTREARIVGYIAYTYSVLLPCYCPCCFRAAAVLQAMLLPRCCRAAKGPCACVWPAAVRHRRGSCRNDNNAYQGRLLSTAMHRCHLTFSYSFFFGFEIHLAYFIPSSSPISLSPI